MSLSKDEMMDLYYLLDEIDVKQSYKVLLRLKEVPPEGTDVVKEAVNAFMAIPAEGIETYQFFKEIKATFTNIEDWEELINV